MGVGTGGGQVGKGSGYSVHGGLQEAGAPEGAAFPGSAAYLTFLRLSALICEMGMIVVLKSHRFLGRTK